MGFDIECIIDIHTYPGEYFCPVCRTLVYPSEALQSQCTHLYCKPCLAHIANGSRACPYDGYLVTESDSKPLMESDKTLAENIGKVKVHCLYFRSGCAWEGTLSDCSSHCAACSFGNSPVICNRCGIQIIHRQVHEHAQICSGVYEGQQAVGGASASIRSATTTSAAVSEVSQSVGQSGPPSQAHNSQNVGTATVAGQNPNLHAIASSQPSAAAPVTAPTSDHWYQQQYQQYYQQHMGYDPYQQPNQQYYPVQSYQQYQQHPVQVSDQHQSQGQAVPSTHFQTQPQPQAQPQPQPQSLPVPQATSQPHLQKQAQAQPQLQLPPQVQPQVQVPPQAQAQGHMHAQGPAPNYQVNPQQLPNPPLRPQNQIPPQGLPPPPQTHSAHPPQYGQVTGMRPPVQNPQVLPYQQPPLQMHHHQASQAHAQPQMQSQAQPPSQAQSQPQPQPQNLQNVQTQPQAQPYLTHSQAPPVFPPQANQSTVPTSLPQAPHPPLPVSGNHSYQPPHPAQKMQPGFSQQFVVQPHQTNASLHPAQGHGQVPQQPATMRPPSQVQQPSVLLSHSQVPGMPPAQHHQFTPQAPPPALPIQNHPVTQPVQQALPQQYAQQQYPGPLQNQSHQQGHPISMQQPQLRSYGPPQPQQSQSYGGRPVMSSHGMHSQNHPFSSDFGPPVQSGHSLLPPAPKSSVNENYVKPTVLENNANGEETRSPLKGHAEKHLEGDISQEKLTGQNEKVLSGSDKAASEKDFVHGSRDQAFGGNSIEAGAAVGESSKVEGNSVANSDSLNQVNLENKVNSSGPYDKHSHAAPSVSGNEGLLFSQQPYGSHYQSSDIQVKGQPPLLPGAQGPVVFPHHGQSLNPSEGRTPGYYGPPPKSFESQSTPYGIPGRPLPIAGSQSGSSESTLMKTHPDEPGILRMNGGTASDSNLASNDEKLKPLPREHLIPYPGDQTQPFDQASRSFDKAAHGPIHDAGLNMNPGALGAHPGFLPPHNNVSGAPGHMDMFGAGPDFGQHHMKHFARRSPGREYFGSSPRGFGGSTFPRGNPNFDDLSTREALRYGEGSRSFSLPGQVGNPFHDGRFPPMSGPPRGGSDIGGSGNPRFGDDVFGPGPDGSDHFGRGKFSGPEYLSGQFNMGESAGPGAFPGYGRAPEMSGPGNFHRQPFTNSIRGDRHSFAHFGEPPMPNNYPLPGFPNSGRFSSGMDSFEPRKRKPVSSGWCRICEIDCESVEGLDLHSQTREHQKMAMEMVKSIKMQNKKQRAGGQMVHEGGRNRKTGIVGRGSKP